MTDKDFSVLLIDDEELILRALNRTLSRLLPRWNIMTLLDAHQLTELLAKGLQPDVVISDRLMPGMTGEQVLQRVRQLHPLALRCVLTADNSSDLLLDDRALIHFYLAKPFTEAQLLQVFDCAEQLRALNFSAGERAYLGRLGALPVVPPLYQQIEQLLLQPDYQLKTLAELISQDPVISSRLMQLANSAFLGFPRSTSSLVEAIARLGLDMLKSIVLTLKTSQYYQDLIDPQQHQRITEQAFEQACLARTLCQNAQLPVEVQDMAFLVSLLDCLGWMAEHMQQPEMSDEDACHFSMISAYLLTLWGFEKELVTAVIVPDALADCTSLLAVVHWLAHKLREEKHYQPDAAEVHILQSLQLYPAWTELQQKLMTS
jgi:HD-like signal output (HDOD) protein